MVSLLGTWQTCEPSPSLLCLGLVFNFPSFPALAGYCGGRTVPHGVASHLGELLGWFQGDQSQPSTCLLCPCDPPLGPAPAPLLPPPRASLPACRTEFPKKGHFKYVLRGQVTQETPDTGDGSWSHCVFLSKVHPRQSVGECSPHKSWV